MSESAATCPGCGAPLPLKGALHGFDRLHGTPGTFEVRVCSACGSGRTLPPVAAEELGRFYPGSYGAHVDPHGARLRSLAAELFRRRYRRTLERPPLTALRTRPPGRLLDVGAGRGDLGVALQEQGWQVTGLEPSQAACEQGRDHGVRMVQGTLGSVDAHELGAGYDAVVFQHALEHVVEPGEDLVRAGELLCPGGLLLIMLPNFGSWQSRAFGGAWFHLDLPRHRAHFTPAGLERLLRRSGFEHVALSTRTTVDGLPMSLQYRLFGRRRFDRGFGVYAAFGLSLTLLPVTAAANALGGGGDELGVSAVRPNAG